MIRRMRIKSAVVVCGLLIGQAHINAAPQSGSSRNPTMIRPGHRSVDLAKQPVRRRTSVVRTNFLGPATLLAPVESSDKTPFVAPPIKIDAAATHQTIGELATPATRPGFEPAELPFPVDQTFQNGQVVEQTFPPMSAMAVDVPHVQPLNSGFTALPPSDGVNTLFHGSVMNGKAELLTPYFERAQAYQQATESINVKPAPPRFSPWWAAKMHNPVRSGSSPLSVTLDQLTVGALQYSPRVQAIKVDPQIRQQTVIAEDAEFDWTAFLDTTWDDTSEPVGSTLTTGAGGPARFRDHRLESTGGLRKRTRTGGELEISQRLGFQDNNSQFFLPSQQGTARLALNYTHPLARESGRVFNQSRIVLAQLEEGVSRDRLVDELQVHLLDVSRSFWELYRARAVYLQKQKLLASAEKIQDMLEGRQLVDSVRRQILRSRAAVASRKSEIARAGMEIRNSESRLRQLVNHPSLIAAGHVEVLPNAAPLTYQVPVSISESLQIALQNRPDISEAIKAMRAMSVRLGVARKDLLPRLDLVLGAYVSGLEGGSDIDIAWGNQFTEGEPSYSAGLLFEVPLGNRAAKARFKRRELELHQSLQEFKATIEAGITDVEVTVREADTSFKEVQSRYHAMQAAEKEADYLSERWKLVPGSDRTTSFLLEDLLDAQERAAQEQLEFVTARVNYMLSLADIKRATGTLLQSTPDLSYAQNQPVHIEQSHIQPAPMDSTQLPMEGNHNTFPTR